MGALSFAAGTLASISSAFSPRIQPAERTGVADLVIDLDDSARRILDEFSTGMSMLYKHGSRNPCDISVIANQNLKLLLRNLKANSSFSNSIIRIRNVVNNNQQCSRIPLFSSMHISASLFYLPADTSIPPGAIWQRQSVAQSKFKEAASFSSDDQAGRQHFLALIGLSEITLFTNTIKSKILLKAGDAYSQTCMPSNIESISSNQNSSSLLLNIQLPAA